LITLLDFHIKHQFLAFPQSQGAGFIKLGVLSHYGNFLLYPSSRPHLAKAVSFVKVRINPAVLPGDAFGRAAELLYCLWKIWHFLNIGLWKD